MILQLQQILIPGWSGSLSSPLTGKDVIDLTTRSSCQMRGCGRRECVAVWDKSHFAVRLFIKTCAVCRKSHENEVETPRRVKPWGPTSYKTRIKSVLRWWWTLSTYMWHSGVDLLTHLHKCIQSDFGCALRTYRLWVVIVGQRCVYVCRRAWVNVWLMSSSSFACWTEIYQIKVLGAHGLFCPTEILKWILN